MEHSLIDPGNKELRVVVHGWIRLGAHGSAGPALMVGEVVKVGPAVVL